ncbi:hypothetical protein [Rhodococcus sp. YH3-3]|uniref:Uncharacterized protein n=1 Tax=Rhodococcus baikonurensis TaxID=172041 RepID=A0ABV5XL43_9NOCA|nr:hypothetical protein [Rhodococcus sp. YH3-3]
MVPGTAVVTVGSSPVPVVLSIRATSPSRVVLMCSERTRVEAGRIVELVASADVRIDIVECGSGTDFSDSYTAVWEGLTRIGVSAPFLLDYTGGTSAMVAIAVAIHQRLHINDTGADRPDLRLYQNESDGSLQSDSGTKFALRSAMTIAEMANVHGFGVDMARRSPSPAVVWDRPVLWERAFLQRGHQRDAVSEPTVELRRALEGMFELVADPGCERSTGGGDELSVSDQVWSTKADAGGDDRAGKTMELAALAVLVGRHWDEVAFSCEVRSIGGKPKPVAEFDVIVRRGHQIVVVEVKSSLRGVAESAGRRLVAARTVFGGATRVLSISPRRKTDDDPDEVGGLEELAGQWEPALASLGRWHRLVLEHGKAIKGLRKAGARAAALLPAPTNALDFAWPAAPSDSLTMAAALPVPSDGQSATEPDAVREHPLVTAVGGSPLAVDSVLAVTSSETSSIGRPDALRAYDSRRGEQSSRCTSVLEVAGLDARSIDAACGQLRPSTLAITPATKSVTAGMTAVAARGDHDLLHVDIASGYAHSWRHGRWPHRHRAQWESTSNPQYELGVDGSWWRRLESAGHVNIPALEALLHGLHLPPGARVRYSPIPDVSWLVPILITGSWRAIGVVAPTSTTHSDRSMVMGCDHHVSSMVGDVGRLLIAAPSGVSAAQQARSWSALLRQNPAPLFAFWRDRNPSTVEFDGTSIWDWLR